jgi:hypothetical protein
MTEEKQIPPLRCGMTNQGDDLDRSEIQWSFTAFRMTAWDVEEELDEGGRALRNNSLFR